MSYISSLAKAKNHGSAHEGLHHWWLQRLTAVALFPLILYFLFSFSSLVADYGMHREDVILWIQQPINALLLAFFLIASYWHAGLGLQVVIEDYIQGSFKLFTIIMVKLLIIAFMMGSIFALLVVVIG